MTLGTKYHENAIIFGLEAKRQRRKNRNPEPAEIAQEALHQTLAGSATRDAARVKQLKCCLDRLPRRKEPYIYILLINVIQFVTYKVIWMKTQII